MSEPKVKKRMQPKHGGDPCPLPPICYPRWDGTAGMQKKAAEYVKVLEAELAIDEEGKRKWSGSQRQYLRRTKAVWRLRALGEDAHFNKHGNFIRPFNAEPPGNGDLIQAELRRKELLKTGEYVSSIAHKQKRLVGHSVHVNRIVRRWAKQHGTKNIDPPDD